MFLLYNDAHFVFFSKTNKQNNKKPTLKQPTNQKTKQTKKALNVSSSECHVS